MTVQMSPVTQKCLNSLVSNNQSLRFVDLTLHTELSMITLVKQMNGVRKLIFAKEGEGQPLYQQLVTYSQNFPFDLLHIKSSKQLQLTWVEYLCSNLKVSKMRVSGVYSWLDDPEVLNSLQLKYPFLRFIN